MDNVDQVNVSLAKSLMALLFNAPYEHDSAASLQLDSTEDHVQDNADKQITLAEAV